MNPVDFPEANTNFGPPSDLEESQCMTIRAFAHNVEQGSVEGLCQIVVAWKPTFEDLERLKNGGVVYLSMMGGLAPHYLSTDFYSATHPA